VYGVRVISILLGKNSDEVAVYTGAINGPDIGSDREEGGDPLPAALTPITDISYTVPAFKAPVANE
jgi:hypothetical protein